MALAVYGRLSGGTAATMDPFAATAAGATAEAGAAPATRPYGAATASLEDPACRPGTPEFSAAKAVMDDLLLRYRERVKQLGEEQKKPDMIAYSELQDPTLHAKYGLLPGIAVGTAYAIRGEMAVLGLHNSLVKGIDTTKDAVDGAYAICDAGNYKKNGSGTTEGGHSFWYCGAGCQGKDRIQTRDQTFEYAPNAALVRNHKTGTPVRVFRAVRLPQQQRQYVYEGLYQVAEYKQVHGKDGFLVCQFRMQGVPGYSIHSTTSDQDSSQRSPSPFLPSPGPATHSNAWFPGHFGLANTASAAAADDAFPLPWVTQTGSVAPGDLFLEQPEPAGHTAAAAAGVGGALPSPWVAETTRAAAAAAAAAAAGHRVSPRRLGAVQLQDPAAAAAGNRVSPRRVGATEPQDPAAAAAAAAGNRVSQRLLGLTPISLEAAAAAAADDDDLDILSPWMTDAIMGTAGASSAAAAAAAAGAADAYDFPASPWLIDTGLSVADGMFLQHPGVPQHTAPPLAAPAAAAAAGNRVSPRRVGMKRTLQAAADGDGGGKPSLGSAGHTAAAAAAEAAAVGNRVSPERCRTLSLGSAEYTVAPAAAAGNRVSPRRLALTAAAPAAADDRVLPQCSGVTGPTTAAAAADAGDDRVASFSALDQGEASAAAAAAGTGASPRVALKQTAAAASRAAMADDCKQQQQHVTDTDRLADGGRPAKRQCTPPSTPVSSQVPLSREALERQIKERQASGKYGRLVTLDISAGLEQVPIPMWNSVDADDVIGVGVDTLSDAESDDYDPHFFSYMSDYSYGEAEARAQAIQAEQHFMQHFASDCGIQFHGGRSCYSKEGRLLALEPSGVMECDSDCKSAPAAAADGSCSCKSNTVLQAGIRYPLEVFKTSGKGWGVRCSVDVQAGTVLCPYIGLIITKRTAEMLRGFDIYMFNLDHFHRLLKQSEPVQQQQQQQQGSEQQPEQQQQQQQRRRKHSVPELAQPQEEQQQQQQRRTSPRTSTMPEPQQQQQQQQQGSSNGEVPGNNVPSRSGGRASLPPLPPPPAAAAAGATKQTGRKRQQQQAQQQQLGLSRASSLNPNLPSMPPGLQDTYLVVDASHEGNVARFLNHSCAPNCMVQPVLARNARSRLLYYMAIVAKQDIPAFTELTYSYGSGSSPAGEGRERTPCLCGATTCNKWLPTG